MKKLPLGIRFLLGLISLLLCVALFATTLCAALLGDLSVVFRKDNLQQLISQALFANSISRQVAPSAGTSGGYARVPVPSSKLNRPDSFDITIPEDVMNSQSASAMVEWIYDSLIESGDLEENIPSLEEVQDFVNESTLDDFLAEKSASLVSDIVTGENTTTLTIEEITQQVEQNAPLIEKTFGVPMDTEMLTQITTAVAETEVVKKIQEEGVNSIVEELVETGAIVIPDIAPVIPNVGGFLGGSFGNADGLTNPSSPMASIEALRSLVSTSTLLSMIGVCVALIVLLLLVNIKQIWVGIRDAGITVAVASLPLCAVTIVALLATDMLNELLGSITGLFKAVMFIINLTIPIHFGLLGLGIVLIIVSCIVRSAIKRKALKTAKEIPAENAVAAAMDEPAAVAQLVQEVLAEDVAEAAEEADEETADQAEEAEELSEEAPEEEVPAESV